MKILKLLTMATLITVGLVGCTNIDKTKLDSSEDVQEQSITNDNEESYEKELEYKKTYEKDEIYKAANVGDIDKVEEILKTNPNVDERDSFGGTAMFQDNTDIVRLLIENGYDVNAIGPSNGYTPLHDAVWANNVEAAKILIENGADSNIKGKDGLTPLEKAKEENKIEMYDYLMSVSN